MTRYHRYNTDGSQRAPRVRYLVCSEQSLARTWANLGANAYQVDGEGVNCSSAPSSYKEGKATPGFHEPRATPMRSGRSSFKRNILVVQPGVRVHSTYLSPHATLSAIGVGPLGLSKQKTVNTSSWACVSRSQPTPLHTASCTVTFTDGGPFDVLPHGTGRS